MLILSIANGNGTASTSRDGLGKGTFYPFADLLSAQAARPAQLAIVNLRTLTPFQRALVSIDGTVTKFIEAYTLEPVESLLLHQQTQQLPTAHPWLELATHSEVIARQVLLRGRYSATVYAYAVSLLAPTRLPPHLLHDLAKEPAGLGRVLLNSQIENRREILWYGRETIADLPADIARYTGHEFISRTYRILAGGQPLMLINEKFPTHVADRIPPTA